MAPTYGALAPEAALDALRRIGVSGLPARPAALTEIDDGVNRVFAVPRSGAADLVAKFGTFSVAESFLAGVCAARLLAWHTELPIPRVVAFGPDPTDAPPVVATERLPGTPTDQTEPGAFRGLGNVIRGFDGVPAAAVDGYGQLVAVDQQGAGEAGADGETKERDSDPTLVARAEYDDAAEWLVAYGTGLYADPPEHDRVAALAPAAREHLRAARDRLPSDPSPSVVVTDFGSGNCLSTDDPTMPTGIVDLERAKAGPAAFAAVNAEYLAARHVDPGRVRRALYDPLPFGPDVPHRELYRLIALGRSVHALDTWHEPGTDRHRRRGDAVANAVAAIVD